MSYLRCQDASGCTNEPLHGSNFCGAHIGARMPVSRRDFHPPCTRCGADDHSFVDCRRAPAPDLAPLLERIALELEIANRQSYLLNVLMPEFVDAGHREFREPRTVMRESSAWPALLAAIEKRKP